MQNSFDTLIFMRQLVQIGKCLMPIVTFYQFQDLITGDLTST